ncbi:hypothetical protein BDEG_28604 [Batrachochytrium dendrobatidis JEL423]|uniref:Uncharacterized protein n=1 Tax=Batrachochytrium dendrobatidis (strain JEL423) TaxID=403673 RepID=A0A177X0Q1_BATDL|nr:hypothetical protein BDEG_28604 [Batrachochytrium dendrobatidis JEL423]
MKLAVAVLSSILLACSVTIANPIDPSATTSTESSTSTFIPSATTSTEASTSTFIPSTKGIGISGLDPLPGNVKHLLDKYVEIKDGRNQQRKIYCPLKSRYDSQYEVVINLKVQKAKLDLEHQRSKFAKFRKDLEACQSEIGRLVEKKWKTDKRIVGLVFGTPVNIAAVPHQTFLIKEAPSVKDYLEQQLLKYESVDQNPSDQEYQNPSDQQRQDSQSSSNTPSGSGSSEQEAPPNKRKRVSKLMDGLKSLFQRPKREDLEPLI